ncbi:MAG: DUF4349 domain-containing protein [Actinobacteria bacterium]|nr:DUF4349 domain-containing protein [Actinomycetota bacterium]
MSQRDLTAELRAARIAAPTELRDRVRLLAAAAEPSTSSRFTWRRPLVLVLPVAAAIVAAAVVISTRPSGETTAADGVTTALEAQARSAAPATANGTNPLPYGAQTGAGAAKLAPTPSATRAQDYGAFLALRVPTPERVSDGVKDALHITGALGGYPTSVHATSTKRTAVADLTLKVPRTRVQQAITKLSGLGTIASERVDVQDVQAGLDQTGRTIDRLQRRLRDLRAQTQTPVTVRQIASLTARVESLQRSRAAAAQKARYATVSLHLATPQTKKIAPAKHGHGPLHGLGVAFHWIWIGAVYALALGLPLLALAGLLWLALRSVRRRREDALLSSP